MGKSDKPPKAPANLEFKMFIGGLPFQATEAVLRKDFGECGEIEAFKMPMNQEGKPKGIAWVTYKTQEACDKAMVFDGTDYGGRTLQVNKADGGKGKGKSGKDGKDGKDKGKGKDKGNKGKGQGKVNSDDESVDLDGY